MRIYLESTMMNYMENYKIANPERDYFVPVNFKIAKTKKEKFSWLPSLAGQGRTGVVVMITIMFACFVV